MAKSAVGIPSLTVPEDGDHVSNNGDCDGSHLFYRTKRQLIELLHEHALVLQPTEVVAIGSQEPRDTMLSEEGSMSFQYWEGMVKPTERRSDRGSSLRTSC